MFDQVLDLVVALDGDGDDSTAAGGYLLYIAEGFFVLEDAGGVVGVLGGDADYRERLVDEGVGAVLHLAGGVAFGVDVGDLLKLECAFEGDGVVDASAEEEEVVGVVEEAGEVLAVLFEGDAGALAALDEEWREGVVGRGERGRPGDALGHASHGGGFDGEHGLELAGELGELVGEVEGLLGSDGAADLGEVEREDEESRELRGEGLGGGDTDLGPGVGGDGSVGSAGDGGADDVADAEGLGSLVDELGLGGDGVGGLAGLGDEQADGAGVGDGVAVAILAGVVDVDGEAGEALDHELSGESGVPGGAAGGDGDLGGVADLVVGEVEIVEVDVPGVEGDAAEGGVADGAGLLVDLLEHEVLVAGFFGLDGVPGDALDLEGQGPAFEVREGDSGEGEDGELAVGEEVDVAGVVEDAGDVGGEEELALADADDGGRAHAGGDELVGVVGGHDSDGEGSGEVLDGLADGFFEGEVGGVFELLLDEVGDDLGVGLGDELVALGGELLLEGEVVFDDAVMDDDEGAGAVAVRVRVLFGGAAVGGPAGVADAEGAVDGVVGDDGLEVAQLAGGAAELQGALAIGAGATADGDAGGVITAIFKTTEAFDNDRDDGFRTDVTNDSTHGMSVDERADFV